MAQEPWKHYCCPACYVGVLKARAWAAELKSREVPYTPAPPRPPPKPAPPPKLQPPTKGCVFAKSCTLPNGVIEHNNPNGFVPLESLNEYGAYAVLGTMGAPIPTAVVDVLRGADVQQISIRSREIAWLLVQVLFRLGQAMRDLSFEMHSRVLIDDGEAVYGVDNLSINTPKNHIKLHERE